MTEFELIEAFRAAAGGADGAGLLLGGGDDAALLAPPAGELLAVSVDTALAGRHFPVGAAGDLIGWRALAMNLSDLAAMGARPWCAFAALTLPTADADFVRALGRGWRALAAPHGVLLAGGNVTRGELSLTITVVGLCSPGMALTRAGARAGDELWVSGQLGLAAIGLASAETATGLDALTDPALARFWAPQPRISLGLALQGVASACIDVSDGLVADLGHLAAASGVLAEVLLEGVPCAGQALAALAAGDDYELCFSAAPDAAARVRAAGTASNTPVTCIGAIRAGTGVRVISNGRPVEMAAGGYRHFD